MPIELSRREALRILSLMLAIGSFPTRAADASPAPRRTDSLAGRNREGKQFLGTAHQAAIAIGRHWLEQHSGAADRSSLQTSLGLSTRHLETWDRDEVAKSRQRLSERHRLDFVHDRVETLDGFLLSQTELQLASLLFLISKTAAGQDAGITSDHRDGEPASSRHS